jgi:hypothetical protein
VAVADLDVARAEATAAELGKNRKKEIKKKIKKIAILTPPFRKTTT